MKTSLWFGIFLFGFGLFTLVARFVAPDSGIFRKLKPMQDLFGEAAGKTLHVFAYTIVPLVAGAAIISQNLLGTP